MSDERRTPTGNPDDHPEWPVELRGVTETVVATLGPNDRWNLAALGVHGAGSDIETEHGSDTDSASAWARTFGRTRTWRNFQHREGGVVQFTRDPVDFVEAALSVREDSEPVLDSADAWVRVSVRQVDRTVDDDLQIDTWELTPVESSVERETVPTLNRGNAAVIEATVWASRVDVDSYDTARLVERLSYLESVVEACGGERDRMAFGRIRDLVDVDLEPTDS